MFLKQKYWYPKCFDDSVRQIIFPKPSGSVLVSGNDTHFGGRVVKIHKGLAISLQHCSGFQKCSHSIIMVLFCLLFFKKKRKTKPLLYSLTKYFKLWLINTDCLKVFRKIQLSVLLTKIVYQAVINRFYHLLLCIVQSSVHYNLMHSGLLIHSHTELTEY